MLCVRVFSDGSTDMDDAKLYPLVVRYLDPSLEKIVCSLLTMVEWKKASTGENIFELLDAELAKRSIPWSNCVSFTSDNASVMSGMGKGVAGHISRVQPSVYFMGCACHLMNIAAQKAANVLPCPVSDVLIDMFFYLDKSANRKQQLKEFQGLYGDDTRKILKLVNTRWLVSWNVSEQAVGSVDSFGCILQQRTGTNLFQSIQEPHQVRPILHRQE
jgi:hypothetical protein